MDIELLSRLNGEMDGEIMKSQWEFIEQADKISSDAQPIVESLVSDVIYLLEIAGEIVDAHPDPDKMNSQIDDYKTAKQIADNSLDDAKDIVNRLTSISPMSSFEESTAKYEGYVDCVEQFVEKAENILYGLERGITLSRGEITIDVQNLQQDYYLEDAIFGVSTPESTFETVNEDLDAIVPELSSSLNQDKKLIKMVVDLAS